MDNTEEYTDELPEEIRQMADLLRIEKAERVEALGKEAAKCRDEAVAGREATGIENTWREDREFYYGIDDANRETQNYVKPTGTTGGIAKGNDRQYRGSTAFFNIVRQFCDAGSARMGDILLPAGDWNFTIKKTPVPDEDVVEEEPQMPQLPGQAKPKEAKSTDKTEKAELRIRDWLTECSYHTEVRKAIEDAAIVGTGIIKGPVPTWQKAKRVTTDDDGNVTMEIVEETVPATFHVKPENLFPDPSCGDDIQKGQYLIERDAISAKKLRELKRAEGYIESQIEKVLDEGPNRQNYDGGFRTEKNTQDKDSYEIWYHYGLVDINDLDAMGVDVCKDESARDMVPAVITLVNDTAIKAFVDPLSSGEFPYDIFPWQRRDDMPWGIGIARQGRVPQEQFNAAGRGLMENAGLGSAPQIIIRDGAIYPADGDWVITRGKVWRATEEADTRSVSDAFMAVNIPMMQVELSNIMEQARKMMEEATGIFFIMQGQQGSAPDTVGGMELLNRNASAILRRLARTFDERVTERHIKRYYEYLLEYGEDDEKGDVRIEAIGSTALVERDMQEVEAMTFLNMSLNPAFGIDPEKAVHEVLKAKRFNPDKWLMDDEKKAELAQRQPPPLPQVEVAKIRAEADAINTDKKLQADAQKTQATLGADAQKTQATLGARVQSDRARDELTLKKIQDDTDRDLLYNKSLGEREQAALQLRYEELMLKRELALLDYANKNEISLGKVKSDLAQTAMKLNLQKELSGGVGGEVITPAIEPSGRAPDGESFQK